MVHSELDFFSRLSEPVFQFTEADWSFRESKIRGESMPHSSTTAAYCRGIEVILGGVELECTRMNVVGSALRSDSFWVFNFAGETRNRLEEA
jgi:hypothetical protein